MHSFYVVKTDVRILTISMAATLKTSAKREKNSEQICKLLIVKVIIFYQFQGHILQGRRFEQIPSRHDIGIYPHTRTDGYEMVQTGFVPIRICGDIWAALFILGYLGYRVDDSLERVTVVTGYILCYRFLRKAITSLSKYRICLEPSP